jgi:hypothetical protein
MKLLRSPWIVGVLAIVAVLVVANSIFPNAIPHVWRQVSPGTATTPAAAPVDDTPAPAPPPPAAPTTPAHSAAAPVTAAAPPPATPSFDVASIRANAARWASSPRRDPFMGRRTDKDSSGPRAAQLLTLNGVWRQTNGTLAIINGRVLIQGETIEGFTVDRIEPDRVWVAGPNGREPLEFTVPAAALRSSDDDNPTEDTASQQQDLSDPPTDR